MKSADYVIPLSRRQTDLIKQIDDFHWEGKTEQAAFLETQLHEVEDLIGKGEVHYPLF